MARMASPSPSIDTACPPKNTRARSTTKHSGRLSGPVKVSPALQALGPGSPETACGTVLEGLEGLLLGRDRLDLPAQFEAVQGPPLGSNHERRYRPHSPSDGRPGYSPRVPALVAGPGVVMLPRKPHAIDPGRVARPSQTTPPTEPGRA